MAVDPRSTATSSEFLREICGGEELGGTKWEASAPNLVCALDGAGVTKGQPHER